jgi:pimeloyl-ACP methyl ester carboxylesterase
MRAFDDALPHLASRFRVYAPERRGHGHTPDVDGPLALTQMADDTIGFIRTVIGAPVALFGYSDGATVAIMVAAKRPDLITRLFCAAGVFHHDGWHEGVIDPEAEAPDFMGDAYGEVSPDGRDHYSVVWRKIAEAHLNEPSLTEADLARIPVRTLILVADDDEVRLDHAVRWYEAMPNAELMVMPGTSHAMVVEKPELFMAVMLDFFENDPVPTYVPLRRAS